MIRLAARTLPVFAAIIGFAMALAAYLNFSGVRTAYLDLVRARAGMIARDIAADASAAQGFGIRLTEQRTLAELLARQAATDPLILSIDVTTPDGRVLFSSAPARAGAPAPPAGEDAAFRQAEPVIGALGAPVGEVLVRLDGATMDATVAGLRRDVLLGAVPAGLGAVATGCLLALALLSRLRARARRASAAEHADMIAEAENEMAGLRPSARR
ncbi:hypothetical protein [uncultured Albimonas sp.]|uniref:hypothetical protein n=1 Tax=uncultured Albimonas sp. TaxID=1331701 RepID=UPI0030EE3CC0|tara:strand:- start:424 stop:1065 length:642 start_codon:yes stop_codon:yes gene_type:complete